MLHPSTDIIMNAQQFFAADQSEANLVKLLHAVSVMLQEGAEVLIPTAADAPEGQLQAEGAAVAAMPAAVATISPFFSSTSPMYRISNSLTGIRRPLTITLPMEAPSAIVSWIFIFQFLILYISFYCIFI